MFEFEFSPAQYKKPNGEFVPINPDAIAKAYSDSTFGDTCRVALKIIAQSVRNKAIASRAVFLQVAIAEATGQTPPDITPWLVPYHSAEITGFILTLSSLIMAREEIAVKVAARLQQAIANNGLLHFAIDESDGNKLEIIKYDLDGEILGSPSISYEDILPIIEDLLKNEVYMMDLINSFDVRIS